MQRTALALVFLLVTGGWRTVPAQGGQNSDGVVTFKSSASYVRMDVQVVDNGKLVKDLAKDDFVVFDENQKQQIAYFGRESEPLTLLLLLDVSGSVSKQLDLIAARAQDALRNLRMGDRVGVMVFARTTRIVEPFTTDFAEVAREIKDAVHDESVGTATLINSAVLDASAYMKTLDRDPHAMQGRRAILIITDNFSINYQTPDDMVIRDLEASNTVFNALVIGKGHKPAPPRTDRPTNPDFTPADVFLLSDESGGEAVKADRADVAFQEMIERIRTRYTLQYRTPENAMGGFRRVRVALGEDARRRYPNAESRSRRGYFVQS